MKKYLLFFCLTLAVFGALAVYVSKKNSPALGATFQVPAAPAFYEDSLASGITSVATSFTLVRGTDKHGTNLASSTYGMVIDEGNSSTEEIVLADCTATACTNVTRGISVLTGTSTASGAAKAHRRGASVKITTAPSVPYLINIMRGLQKIENILSYTSSITSSSLTAGSNQLASVAYVDGVAIAGASDASLTTKGILEIATGAEAAAGTLHGKGNTAAYLALTSDIATSSLAVAGNWIVVTGSNGLINPGMMPTSSPWILTSSLFAQGTTTFSGSAFSVSAGTTTISSATTTFSNINAKVGIGTSTPTLAQGLSIASSTYIAGGLAIGTTATSSVGNVAIGNYLQINGGLQMSGTASTSNLNVNPGGCSGCTNPTIVSGTGAGPTGAGHASKTVTCSGSQVVVGGGSSNTATGENDVVLFSSYPSSATQWTAEYECTGSCSANTITTYAICAVR